MHHPIIQLKVSVCTKHQNGGKVISGTVAWLVVSDGLVWFFLETAAVIILLHIAVPKVCTEYCAKTKYPVSDSFMGWFAFREEPEQEPHHIILHQGYNTRRLSLLLSAKKINMSLVWAKSGRVKTNERNMFVYLLYMPMLFDILPWNVWLCMKAASVWTRGPIDAWLIGCDRRQTGVKDTRSINEAEPEL